ncbi:hypothetical protein ACWCOP_03620 [Maricaulaceae bacterium MS644]
MTNTTPSKRIMARQKAVAIRQLGDQEVDAVSGASSWVPTVPGADVEIFPGIFGEPWTPPSDGGTVKTLGYNEP